MRRHNQQLRNRVDVRVVLGIATVLLFIGGGAVRTLAQNSVEKSETSQQAKAPEDELALARAAVRNPEEKPAPPETGRIMGDYSIRSSLEVGYRFVDVRGNSDLYRSEVDVRRGLRVLGFSLDARSISGQSHFFDFLRADVSNAGGDQSQSFSVRADKTRFYKFDASVRRFDYFRFLPAFALGEHNYDLSLETSDYNLKLFPQRRVRINLGYARSRAKGPDTTTYDYQRNEFPLDGAARWATNDYRVGTDIILTRNWEFFFEEMFRRYNDDTNYFQDVAVNHGNEPTSRSLLTFFNRDNPTRMRGYITRGSLAGAITPRAHLVLRGFYGSETLDITQYELTSGVNASGNQIISGNIITTGHAHRPSADADVLFTYDINEQFSISNSFRYTNFRIDGGLDALTASLLELRNGTLQPSTTITLDSSFTGLASTWNTLDVTYTRSRKFSMNAGWRTTHRNVKLFGATEEGNVQSTQNTNTLIAGARYRPEDRLSLFFDFEKGSTDNPFVRVTPLDYRRERVRVNFQATSKLSFEGTFADNHRTNPTPFVQNNSSYRSFSASAFWQPNGRVWLTGGYDFDHLDSTADIVFFTANQLNTGRSIYFARQNSIFTDARFALTNRLDFLMVYRFIQDLGAPSNPLGGNPGPNDFVTALPLRRHNPEGRLAYRFNNHVTGNLSYRHYSYTELDQRFDDYRANILTTSVLFTF